MENKTTYVSQYNPIRHVSNTGEERVWRYGDVIEDFEAFPEHTRRTLLSLGWVKPADSALQAADITPLSMPREGDFVQPIARGDVSIDDESGTYIFRDPVDEVGVSIDYRSVGETTHAAERFDVDAMPAAAQREETLDAVEPARLALPAQDDLTRVAAGAPQPPIVDESFADVMAEDPETEGVTVDCPRCGKKYQGLNGLKIHLARMHRADV